MLISSTQSIYLRMEPVLNGCDLRVRREAARMLGDLPRLLRTAGLAQAIAHLSARGRDMALLPHEREAAAAAWRIIADGPADGVLAEVRALDPDAYRTMTRTTASVWGFVGRIALRAIA